MASLEEIVKVPVQVSKAVAEAALKAVLDALSGK